MSPQRSLAPDPPADDDEEELDAEQQAEAAEGAQDEPDGPDDDATPDSGAPGRRLYLDSHTGALQGHDAAPNPGTWYRLVGNDEEAAQALREGEYPLVVSDAILRKPRLERRDALEQLRQQQYEDPGWIFEQNPQYAPDEWIRTRQAPAGDVGEPAAPRGRSLSGAVEPAGPEPAAARPRSLAGAAGAATGGPGSAVTTAMQPSATPQNLVKLDPMVAQRLHRLLAGRRAEAPDAAALSAPPPDESQGPQGFRSLAG